MLGSLAVNKACPLGNRASSKVKAWVTVLCCMGSEDPESTTSLTV